ncbi:MAG TPA: hypothetical protein VNU68_32170 [Verrucomicrobiae bacterium]|nr:hypothetical protein [Verrucomicrobiae bacterium]
MSDPEIGNAIIAGIASGDGPLEQMSEIVTHLERAGFVIVPREPTADMIERGLMALANAGCGSPIRGWAAGDCFRAMIAAASASHQ